LRRLSQPEDVALERRERGASPPLRDPETLIDLILAPGRGRLRDS
jgi:hypothetical protein